MQKQIEDLRGGAEESKQEQFQQLRATRMEQGRTLLAAELKEMKLPADGDFASMIEDSLASYINADERRTNAFFAGGEALKQVIKEGLAKVKTGLGLYDQSRTSNYTQQKQAAIKRTPSPLPKPGAGKGNAAPTKEKLSQSDIHNRAWEAAQRAWGGQTQE